MTYFSNKIYQAVFTYIYTVLVLFSRLRDLFQIKIISYFFRFGNSIFPFKYPLPKKAPLSVAAMALRTLYNERTSMGHKEACLLGCHFDADTVIDINLFGFILRPSDVS